MLLICLFFLILFLHRCCCFFFFFNIFYGYELSGEIALKNNHYYYSFADDIQLQLSAPPDEISELLYAVMYK